MDKRFKGAFERGFFIFLICAVTGWLYEEFCDVVVMGHPWYNRGFLWGPYLPIYGTLGLAMWLLFGKLAKKKVFWRKLNVMPVLLFFLTAFASTLAELITSYLLEAVIGHSLWNYSFYRFHFEGRIAVVPSLLFGLLGVLSLYLLIPGILKLYEKLPKIPRTVLIYGAFLMMLTDLVIRIVGIVQG